MSNTLQSSKNKCIQDEILETRTKKKKKITKLFFYKDKAVMEKKTRMKGILKKVLTALHKTYPNISEIY